MKNSPLFVLLFFFTVLIFSQEKMDYQKEATLLNANFYEITEKKLLEIESYDMSKIENVKHTKQFKRWFRFWKDRIYADGIFPNPNLGFYNAGILNTSGEINSKVQRNFNSISFAESWINVGPQDLSDTSQYDTNGYSIYPQMGRLNCFLRIKHPTDVNQDVLFVGAPNGGIWKSTDGGANWVPKLDNVAGIGVTDIKTTADATALNYTTKPIYVSTGDYDSFQVNSIGVLKSTDGGETFSSTGLSFGLSNNKITGSLLVINENTVLVGVGPDGNILRTRNGGTSWGTYLDSGYNISIGRVASKGNEALFASNSGVFYSPDVTGSNNIVQVVAPGDNRGNHAVTLGENGDFYLQNLSGQVQRYNVSSNTLSNVGNPTPQYEPQGGYNQALIVRDNIMISGEFNGQVSRDNGETWERLINGYFSPNGSAAPSSSGAFTRQGVYVHSDHHAMGVLDSNLSFWSVNDGGLNYITFPSISSDSPTTEYKTPRMNINQSYTVAINPSSDDGAYLISNQDNDAFSKKGGKWFAVALGDGIQSAINYNDSNIRYTSTQNGDISRTNTAYEGQLNGQYFGSIPGASFEHPLEINKVIPTVLYGGGNDVYRINDTGSSLNRVALSAGVGTVRSIATHGRSSILAAGDSGIKFTSDDGQNWNTVNFTSAFTVNSVDFDATNSQNMYVTVPGYINGSKVFMSTNGGASFTNISGDLPNIVVKEILIYQGKSMLFLATELGVYYTKNNGTNWMRLGGNLPNVDVRDIDIHFTNERLVAATFGRGLWEINIADRTFGIEDNNISNEITLYPNPVTDEVLNISMSKLNTYKYQIFNVVGGIVKQGDLNTLTSKIDVSSLSSNLYILRVVNTQNEASSFKFLKK